MSADAETDPAEPGSDTSTHAAGAMRIDKWLFHARFFKTRALAARLCQNGGVRINGTRIRKAHALVRIGDVLTFAQARQIRVVEVCALLERRGPASEAQAGYADLEPLAEPLPRRQSPGR